MYLKKKDILEKGYDENCSHCYIKINYVLNMNECSDSLHCILNVEMSLLKDENSLRN